MNKNLTKTLITAFFMLIALCHSKNSYAVIPNIVSTNLTISAIDYCNGPCFINPGVTLTINGNFDVHFNGPVTVYGTLIIQNGNLSTFTNKIVVAAHALMRVDNSIVRMQPGAYIKLNGATDPGDFTNFIGGALVANNATFTGMLITQFWEGIATMRGAVSPTPNYYDRYKEGLVLMDHCVIERARNAVTNYNYIDNPYYPSQTSGGTLNIMNSTFRNNIRSLRLNNDHHTEGEIGGTGYNPNSPDGINWHMLFQYVDFVIDANFSPQTINLPVEVPTEMVYASNCNSLSFFSCRFLSSSNNYGKNMTGIFGVNTGLKVQRYFYNTSAQRGEFKGLGTGIALYNNLEVNRVPVILNCDFDCQNDINLFSCFNSYVVNNKFLKTFADSKYPSTSINLYRGTGYKVEGNTIIAPVSNVTAFAAGIVVNGSGVAYNEIYRNTFTAPTNQYNGLAIGIQSIGRNRNPLGNTGLKILCNDLNTNYYKGKDISVMKDYTVVPSSYQGIHRLQYLQGIISKSAGNTFLTVPIVINPTKNYYVGPGTNSLIGTSPFKYGYQNSQQSVERPTNSNLTNLNYVLTQAKNCAVKVLANMPPPRYDFQTFQGNLNLIEKRIDGLEHQTAIWTEADSTNMEIWMIDENNLIDSIVTYYQFYNYTDSIAMVYEQTTKGYQYKLYLASAYKDLNRFEEAIELLNQLPEQYNLDEMSTEETTRLASLYTTLQWLAENEYDWSNMPDYFKSPVHDYEYDLTSAGGVSISMLAAYEGRRYDPYYIEGDGGSTVMRAKALPVKNELIYPNPATTFLNINWKEPATFILLDISGREVYTQKMDASAHVLDISTVKPGLYFGLIQVGGNTVYQQKIVKQ